MKKQVKTTSFRGAVNRVRAINARIGGIVLHMQADQKHYRDGDSKHTLRRFVDERAGLLTYIESVNPQIHAELLVEISNIGIGQ